MQFPKKTKIKKIKKTKNLRISAPALLLVCSCLLTSCKAPTLDALTTAQTADAPSTSSPVTDSVTTKGESEPTIGYKAGQIFPDEMPTLSISTEDGVSITSKTKYVTASVYLDEPTDKYSFDSRAAKIRCRGNWSYYGTGFDKKAYRLKFDKKINLLGIGRGADKDWVLLANYVDHSLLRNACGLAAARVLDGIDYVSPSAWVRLVINGEDRGVYQLCAQSEIGKWRIDIREDARDLDGNYLIELDSRAAKQGKKENIEYFTSGGRSFVIKNDEYHEGAALFLKDYFDRAFAAIESGDRAAIEEYFELDSFAQMYILQEFVKNPDVGWSSFYIVKRAGGKLSLTCPWDLDLAFGNYLAYNCRYSTGLFVGNEGYADTENSNPFFTALCSLDFFMSDYVCVAWEKYGQAMVNASLAEIDRVLDAYKDEFSANFDIWKLQGTSVYPCPDSVSTLPDLESSVEALRAWINERGAWLEKYFSAVKKS